MARDADGYYVRRRTKAGSGIPVAISADGRVTYAESQEHALKLLDKESARRFMALAVQSKLPDWGDTLPGFEIIPYYRRS